MNTTKMTGVLSALLLTAAAQAAAPTDILTKAGCLACHQVDKKSVGPSYKVVAAKYKGQDMAAKLFEKVRQGGKGVYGPIPMIANGPDKISDDDLKTVIAYILGL